FMVAPRDCALLRQAGRSPPLPVGLLGSAFLSFRLFLGAVGLFFSVLLRALAGFGWSAGGALALRFIRSGVGLPGCFLACGLGRRGIAGGLLLGIGADGSFLAPGSTIGLTGL